jgi:hypothetical protein
MSYGVYNSAVVEPAAPLGDPATVVPFGCQTADGQSTVCAVVVIVVVVVVAKRRKQEEQYSDVVYPRVESENSVLYCNSG